MSKQFLTTLTVVSILIACLTGCGRTPPAKSIEEAKTQMANGDFGAAIVNLKAALAEDSSLAKARLMLGEALLANGDTTAAVVELRKAQSLRVDPATVAPLLVRALIENQEASRVIEEFSSFEIEAPVAKADVMGHVALAQLILGRADKGASLARSALEVDPTSPVALGVLAEHDFQARNFKEALALLDKGLAGHPQDTRLLNQRAMVQLRGLNDRAGAVTTLMNLIAIEPRHIGARARLFGLQVASNDLAGAKEQLDYFQRNLPSHPQTHLFIAILAQLEKDSKRALEAIQAALKAAPSDPQVLYYAGIINFDNQQYFEAERYLSQALALRPGMTLVRQRLAEAYLKLGQFDKSLATLAPVMKMPDTRPRAYLVAAHANLRVGNLEDSIAQFNEALRLEPDNTTAAVQLALARSNAVPFEKTVGELKRIAAAASSTMPDLALVNVLMKGADFGRAAEALAALEKKIPQSPIPATLSGLMAVQRGDKAKARSQFERAIQQQANFLPAISALARLDIAENHPDAAIARLKAAVEAEPKNPAALIEIAKIRMRDPQGKPDVIDYLSRAIKIAPRDPRAHSLLINYLIEAKDKQAALSAAQAAMTAIPDDADILDNAGRAMAAMDDVQQAISALAKLAKLQPNSPHAHARLAGAYLADNKVGPAKESLKKALELAPDFVPAQQALIGIAQQEGQPTAALDIARTVIKQRPKESVGFLMAGAIETNRGDHAAASAVYRQGLKAVPDSRLAASLYSALVAKGPDVDAQEFAAQWTRDHPKDLIFIKHVADSVVTRGNYALAEQYLRTIVAVEPENIAALNNLAYALARQKKSGAVVIAQRAVNLRPDAPGLLDTLATAHAAEGNFAKAVESQRSAITLAPNDLGLRFNLAKLLLAKGDTAEAKTELLGLQKHGDKLPVQAEVKRLLDGLK